MAFLESRMSVHIERGAKVIRTNRGRTKAYTGSGKMAQDFAWSAPISEFDIVIVDSNIDPAVVHFTPYEGLRFRNWADYIGVKTNTSLVNTTATCGNCAGTTPLRRSRSTGSSRSPHPM